jgi:D-alanyl-D-alanine dipeptidase
LAALLLAAGAFAQMLAQAQDSLPAGFVRLRDLAPTIIQDIRYAGPFNFTGAALPGYDAPQCILRREAAEALARAQAQLASRGLTLRVFDCYRPQRAVAAMAKWVAAPDADSMKPVFFPDLDRRRLVQLGYIASRSAHARGVAVDLALDRLADPLPPVPAAASAGRCDGPVGVRVLETRLDFGTAYDCFSPRSATAAAGILPTARANRRLLVDTLRRVGLTNYAREWWHFHFSGIAASGADMDFPVR